jgi:hypothetical protein
MFVSMIPGDREPGSLRERCGPTRAVEQLGPVPLVQFAGELDAEAGHAYGRFRDPLSGG